MLLQTVRDLIDFYGSGVVNVAGMPTLTPSNSGVGLGIALGTGSLDYHLAVRVYEQCPLTQAFLHALDLRLGSEAQVKAVGAIAGPRPGLFTNHQKYAVLAPGVSIAHFNSVAGTIGGFVERADIPGVFILSTNHVLANSNSVLTPSASAYGDPVLHPGPTDSGSFPQDWVADLSDFHQLQEITNQVDAAIAAVRRGTFSCRYAGRTIKGTAPPVQGAKVWKVGRTTVGTVGATELRYAAVRYGFGHAFFEGVFEVTGEGTHFSRGGDSGALVLNEADEAVGLLFAGVADDAADPFGYSLVIPIETVLKAMNAKLLS